MTDFPPDRCPLCARPNACALAAGATCADCWCSRTTIDPAALARLPAAAIGVACLCADCARGLSSPAAPGSDRCDARPDP
ncbi:MAG: cysteine-rich CWC family protein [Planctomycetes bacterium]|nr:cysteine-rich CWC family protein [Planctomycetota bacterium]